MYFLILHTLLHTFTYACIHYTPVSGRNGFKFILG